MAPIEKKRARKEETAKSRKRQKLSRSNGGPEGERISKTVFLNTLPWQEVAFPGSGFEDAEGFFGLEEISDVDVVRDPKLGTVEYKVHEILGCGATVILIHFSRFPRIYPKETDKENPSPF